MPTREEIMKLVSRLLNCWIAVPDDIWVALYRLLLDYAHGVPRITDSNRRKTGVWRRRALEVERLLAAAMSCEPAGVSGRLDNLMTDGLYPPKTQRMNPVGIAFACAVVWLLQR
ncbi:MAG TPA: hypothetical protein ENN09_06400, partial [Planctomycetes bacterium]|nr:hypothetical protein [Planctomycetota bacterium]